MPGCCSAAARRHIPRTCSSTRWCRTPPMQLCCVPGASNCTRRLEAEFPEVVAAQPELLAHHYSEAGRPEQAIRYWYRAGERATERSAHQEAIAHLTRGIEMLDDLPRIPQRDQREFEFQAALVTPFWASRGFGSAEAERAARRAVDLGPQAGTDSPAHFRAIYGLRYSYMLRGNLRAGRLFGAQLLELAGRLHDPELFAYA